MRAHLVPLSLVLLPLTLGALPAATGAPASGAASASRPRCHGLVATVVGTRGDDHLVGTDGPDVIVGLAGADRIEGRGGDDVICGGANVGRHGKQVDGDDIDGGPGSDYLDPGRDRRPLAPQSYGDILRYTHATGGVHVDLSSGTGRVVDGPDTDTVRVAEGLWVLGSQYDDVIIGSRFDDDLEGNRGADTLIGGRGDDGIDEFTMLLSRPDRDVDREVGGPGDDSIQAGRGDEVSGSTGDDVLYEQSHALAARMLGGPGDDRLLAWYDPERGRSVDGGAGVDLLEADDRDAGGHPDVGLVIDASTGEVRTSAAGQAVLAAAGIERWRTDAERPVVFVGTPGPDRVDAWAAEALSAQTEGGDDVVLASSRADTVDTGDGFDRVVGRGGRDTCLHAERMRSCEVTS